MHAALLATLMCLGADAATATITDTAADTVVVCPRALLPALQPWLAYRRGQGHRVVVLPAAAGPDEVRAGIRRQARGGRLRWVLLVGDAPSHSPAPLREPPPTVPTHLADAKINVHWGSEPHLATDNWFADLDDDQVPELAVGRLTADNPDELAVMVGKILDYESQPGSGDWRRRLNCVAGVGGFGGLVDTVLETATKKFLTDGIPAAYQMSMTYGSWRSPFCPDPRRFHQATLERLNEGCLFWIYIGHGQRRFLDTVQVPGAAYRIFDVDDVGKLQRTGGAPIAVFLSCYTGAFDEPQDCLAEELLRSPDGPVAVFSGSRVTMPYAMAVMGNELMHEFFVERRETLGEVVMHAKRRMAATPGGDLPAASPNRQLLDAIAAALSPAPDQLDGERLEHVLLFNLFGDPLLRLNHAQPVELAAAKTVYAGQRIAVSGITPVAGRCTLELVCSRDRTRVAARPRERFEPSGAALDAYSDHYARANDRRWSSHVFACAAGDFECELAVPPEARGPCHVRVFVENGNQHALGAVNVFVRRPPESRTR